MEQREQPLRLASTPITEGPGFPTGAFLSPQLRLAATFTTTAMTFCDSSGPADPSGAKSIDYSERICEQTAATEAGGLEDLASVGPTSTPGEWNSIPGAKATEHPREVSRQDNYGARWCQSIEEPSPGGFWRHKGCSQQDSFCPCSRTGCSCHLLRPARGQEASCCWCPCLPSLRSPWAATFRPVVLTSRATRK